ncbi:MAG: metallophosphoesterase [Pirellulales bacterium]
MQSKSLNQPKTSRLTRRTLLNRAAKLSLLGGALLGWTFFIEPHWLSISNLELSLANLPSYWNGKRLVQISDLHVGQTSNSYLQKCLETVNELQPDLLVVTGDFIDHTGGIEQLSSVLAKLRPAKNGSFACLGNHDYGHRWSDVQLSSHVMSIAKDHGIEVMRDAQTQIDGLTLFGLDDFWSPRNRSAQELLKSSDPNVASICLCHNPDFYDHLDWSWFRGVILSGHTHGGQCKPPFLPPPLLPVTNRLYTSGFIDIGPDQQMYINRGLGHTLQVRFNCRPEITVFTLRTG